MHTKFDCQTITVTGSEKFKSDSAFWYFLKKHINENSTMFLIKKLMTKDGHMVSEGIYYLRDRHQTMCIWDSQYQIRSVAQDFNKEGKVTLDMEKLDKKM